MYPCVSYINAIPFPIGMKPFIPERDLPVFETFLERLGLNNVTRNDTVTGSSRVYR